MGSELRSSHVQRHPISIRPTQDQRQWMEAQRERRGLALNAIVLLAIEQAMAADSVTQAPEPEARQ
jgi:hypothetical protein